MKINLQIITLIHFEFNFSYSERNTDVATVSIQTQFPGMRHLRTFSSDFMPRYEI